MEPKSNKKRLEIRGGIPEVFSKVGEGGKDEQMPGR